MKKKNVYMCGGGKQIDENCDANNHKSLLSATTLMQKVSTQEVAHAREIFAFLFYLLL